MAMANNWISFPFPPIEMVLCPCTNDPNNHALPYSTAAGYDDLIPYQYQFHPQALKLEDFLGGHRSSPALNPSADPQDSSSPTTLHYPDLDAIALPVSSEVEDAASATGTKLGRSPDSVAETAPSARPSPATARSQGAMVRVKTTSVASTAVAASCQRTSIYRGVTRHRWTGRYEAHLWDNTCRIEGQKRKGRQVYLGGYDTEEKAARAYDLAALKYWGLTATLNFPIKHYSKEMEEMKHMCKPEFIASLRRKSSGFSRGASIYRGVTRHHQHGRWQARIGRVAGNKDLYLGTFSTEEEAAEAYDVAAIKFRGANAVTNFELSRYNVEAIANTELPIGATAKRIKQSLQASNSSQVTVASPVTTQYQVIVPPSLDNLMQLYPSAGLSGFSGSPPYIVDNDPDVSGQRLYWLTASSQHVNQIRGNQPVVERDPLHFAPQ